MEGEERGKKVILQAEREELLVAGGPGQLPNSAGLATCVSVCEQLLRALSYRFLSCC